MNRPLEPRTSHRAHWAALAVAATQVLAVAAHAADAPHTAAPPVAQPDLTAVPTLELGETLVRQRCANCHAIEPGATSFAAPLTGLFGRVSGTAEGYVFSPNMKNLAVSWSPETLDNWLAATTFDTPDIRMRHVGIPDARSRAAVIAYISTLEGNRVAKP